MRRLLTYSIIFSLLMLATCKQFPVVNCDECYSNKPDSADLHVKVTVNAENPKVYLTFYRGKVEDKVVEWVDSTTNENFYLLVKVEQYYSVEARYKSGNKTIIAVDGGKINTQLETDACNDNCYILTGGELDVRLHY